MSEETPVSADGQAFRKPVSVAMIVARAENGVIGREGQLPWHISADLQHFKKLTLGKPVIMGRKTYEFIGRPLPRRTNIVITRNKNWGANDVLTASDLPTALALAFEDAHASGVDEIMVIGGAEIYRQALRYSGRIYLTEIHEAYEGDAILDLNFSGWQEVSRTRHEGADSNEPAFSFVELRKAS